MGYKTFIGLGVLGFLIATLNANEDIFGDLPLHDAIRTKNIELVKSLATQKNVNHLNKNGVSPLHLAVQLNQYEMTKFLFSKGAKVNTVDRFNDSALLDSVRSKNSLNLTKFLVCSGADVNHKDKYSLDAKDYAKETGNKELIEFITSKDLKEACKEEVLKLVMLEDKNPNSTIVLDKDNQEVVLDKPYQSAEINSLYEEKLEVKNNDESILSENEKNLIGFHESWSKVREFTINFGYKSISPLENSDAKFEEINNILKICKSCEVTISGYTDSVGSQKYNLELSKKRAEKVKELLNLEKIKNVNIESFGKESPLIKTKDNIKNESNRRVHVIIKEM